MAQTASARRRRSRAGEDQKPLTVAVTGASGTVGRALLTRLRARPEIGRIVAVGRRLPLEGQGEQKVSLSRADLRDAGALRRGIAGADVVVHLAYALHGARLDEDLLFRANVEGTLEVAQAAVATSARRLVYTSSAAVYGFHRDRSRLLTEDEPIRASTRHFYGRHKAQAELLLAQAIAGSEIESYVFRPGVIVGPDTLAGTLNGLPRPFVGGALAVLKQAARAGLRPPLIAPPVPLQAVHGDDVAQAIERAVLGEGPSGVYNLAGSDIVAGQEIPALLGLAHAPVPREVTRLGARALIAAAPFVPALGWAEAATAPLLIDSSRARGKLGWRPRYSSREALADTGRALGLA